MNKVIPSKFAKWRDLHPEEGPWLIWSHYWASWHMRSSTGGAAGYTDNILHAGIFETEKAREYNDRPPHRRDTAVPAHKALCLIEQKVASARADADHLESNLASLRDRLTLSKEHAA